jgi:replication factor A1
MEIKDLKPNKAIDSLEVEVVEVEEAKEFTNFRGTGKLANVKAKDKTGEVKITLWNDQITQVAKGAKIKIENGWVKEYRGELQVSTGKFGKLTLL